MIQEYLKRAEEVSASDKRKLKRAEEKEASLEQCAYALLISVGKNMSKPIQGLDGRK